ncbi:MAG: RsbRD N-terminal domain-containing protein [FCB group bacterium]|nr:RsbRD N-terminal domain-containing protein [FCB group bacterium]
MRFQDLLSRDKTAVKRLWLDLIIETYHPDSHEFFRNQKDKFQNPVGAAMSDQLDSLLDAMTNETTDDELSAILQDFIKIRAVQEFSPSKAVGYILFLKQAVRKIFAKEIESFNLFSEMQALEAKVDKLLLIAFDVYSQAREQLFTIRADELRRSSFMALRLKDSSPQNKPIPGKPE